MSKAKMIFWGSVVVIGGGALWSMFHPLQALVGGVAVAGGAVVAYKVRSKLKGETKPEEPNDGRGGVAR